MKQWIIDEAQQHAVANIGQIDPATKRALERQVKAGKLAKWRGFWYPIAGAPWGIGPLKTCYGPIEVRDYFADFGKVK